MNFKYILGFICSYILMSFIVQRYIKNSNDDQEYGSVIQLKNNLLMTKKPIEIDINSLYYSVNKEVYIPDDLRDTVLDQSSIVKDTKFGKYTFSKYTASPVEFLYTHPITGEVLNAYSYKKETSSGSLPALSLSINGTLITDFELENQDDQALLFSKEYNGYIIKRRYFFTENGLESDILIDNPENKEVGLIQIIYEEQIELAKDISEGGFTYSSLEKIIKFNKENKDLVDSSIILSPEVVGVQSQFFVHSIVSKNFDRGYFNSIDGKKLQYFVDKYIKKEDSQSKISFKLYIGPKVFYSLNAFDPRLAEVMEYGIFSKISRLFIMIILFFTKFFNYLGIALLLFTFLLKIIFIPFIPYIRENNKKSKEFQQKHDYVKAKYHDNPEKRSAEEAELIRKYGVLPGLAAKIPQFLNIFVIFSLQSQLRTSIELYNVPVGLWLTNAAAPDPYYVLPVLFFISIYYGINSVKTITPMMKIGILCLMCIFLYIFSFLPSGIQFFIVLGSIVNFFENKYLELPRYVSGGGR